MVFLSIYFGMHYFVFTRVAGGLNLSGTPRTALRLFFVTAALTFILTEILTHRGGASWLGPAAGFGYIWLGILSIALSIFLAVEISTIVFHGPHYRYNATLAALTLLAAVSAYSLINVAIGPVIKEIKIKTAKLPAETDRLVLVQLSDLHVDMLTSHKWLKNIVAKTNAMEPDVIVITGDLIDARINERPDYCAILRALKSRHGVYAISGNHEYYIGMNTFEETARASNIQIIDGLKASAGEALELTGISDLVSAKGVKAEADIRNILQDTPAEGAGRFRILLSHRPDTFDTAAKLGFDLQLSGHTHAGQIPPMDLLVMLAYKYPWGFYKNGNSYQYTTSGTGTWGPPMRLFSRSEIVKIVLER
jgi:uncharacterized protein